MVADGKAYIDAIGAHVNTMSSLPEAKGKMDLYDYLCDIGVAEEIIEKMKNDKIDDSVVVLMTDAELARYLQHKSHRVLVVDFCNRKHCKSNDNIDKMSQRKKELFAKIKTKLDVSRKNPARHIFTKLGGCIK